jgi:hypothetical protein
LRAERSNLLEWVSSSGYQEARAEKQEARDKYLVSSIKSKARKTKSSLIREMNQIHFSVESPDRPLNSVTLGCTVFLVNRKNLRETPLGHQFLKNTNYPTYENYVHHD